MAQDFGSRGEPAWTAGRRLAYLGRLGQRLGLVAALGLFGSLPTMMALSGGPVEKPPRAEGGRPCRPISRSEFYRGWREAPRVIRFQGIAFARRRGDAFCGMGRDGLFGRPFPICEFDAPVELGVTADGRDSWFDISPGNTAVVEARPKGLRCVVTGRFDFYPS